MKHLALLFGLTMAIVDVIVLSTLKAKYIGLITSSWALIFAFLLYGCQTLIFYYSLHYSTLTQMNLIWNLTSEILITVLGLYFFHETVNNTHKIGIVFAMIALFLLH